jgi:hypothetical protein
LRGDEAGTLALLEATKEDVTRRGEGAGITFAEWANALLNNGLGRYPDALAEARRATSYEADLGSMIWPMVELIEAAARSGVTETAAGACERFAVMTDASGTDWALGLQARSLALPSEGEEAERRYRDSLARLGRTRMRVDLARAHLLTGNGYAGSAAAATRASSCARLTACWRGSARRRSRSRHAASCWPPASECASAPWRPAAS